MFGTSLKALFLRYLRSGFPSARVHSCVGVAQPSALSGAARVIDLIRVFDDDDLSGAARDLRALRSDWIALGDDMHAMLAKCEREHLDPPQPGPLNMRVPGT
jgi:hypothetical protein